MPEVIPMVIPMVLDSVMSAAPALADMAGGIAEGAGGMLGGLGEAASGLTSGIGEAAGGLGESIGDTAGMLGEALPGMDTLGNAAMVGGMGLQGAQGLMPHKTPQMSLSMMRPSTPYNPPTSGSVTPQQMAALAAAGSSSNVGGIAPSYIRTQGGAQQSALGML